MAKQQLRAKAKISKKGVEVTADIQLLEFEENGTYFVSSPALNVVGYGNSLNEARSSFWTTLQEVIEYTITKNTLLKELKKLGWQIKGKQFKTLKAPTLSRLIPDSEELQRLFNSRPIRVVPTQVHIPEPLYV